MVENTMENQGLSIDIVYQDGDLIELTVQASNGLFAGATNAYLGKDGLLEAANSLRGFPRSPGDSRSFVFGDFDLSSAGGGASIKLQCTDPAGHSYAEIRIQTDSDSEVAIQSVLLSFPIEASGVDEFVDGLERMSRSDIAQSRLRRS